MFQGLTSQLGAIISSYNSEFENLDGKGHGVKLETTNMTVRNFLFCFGTLFCKVQKKKEGKKKKS